MEEMGPLAGEHAGLCGWQRDSNTTRRTHAGHGLRLRRADSEHPKGRKGRRRSLGAVDAGGLRLQRGQLRNRRRFREQDACCGIGSAAPIRFEGGWHCRAADARRIEVCIGRKPGKAGCDRTASAHAVGGTCVSAAWEDCGSVQVAGLDRLDGGGAGTGLLYSSGAIRA